MSEARNANARVSALRSKRNVQFCGVNEAVEIGVGQLLEAAKTQAGYAMPPSRRC